MPGPRFFFSYSREDTDVYLDRFYEDLIAEVRSLDAQTESEIAFRDTRDVKLGEDWSRGIGFALQHAKVMVCLHSRKYFNREWCGKEWATFADRVAQLPDDPKSPALIIPVLWTIPTSVPAIGKIGQWTNDSVGAVYAEKGLRHLAKQKTTLLDEYTHAVEVIAEAIDRGIKRALPSAPTLPTYAAARNAFAAPIVAGAAPAPHPSGPKFVQFVVAAAQADEVEDVGGDAANYGSTPLDWMPYAPASQRRVGPLLQSVASHKDFDLDSHTTTLDHNLGELLTKAESQNSLLILTVDPWSVLVPRIRQALLPFDGRLSLNSATLLPWNDDPKTRQAAAMLEGAVRQTLTRHVLTNAPTLHTRVTNENDLVDRLQHAIRRAQGLIVQYGEVQSAAKASTTVSKPQINAKKDPEPPDESDT